MARNLVRPRFHAASLRPLGPVHGHRAPALALLGVRGAATARLSASTRPSLLGPPACPSLPRATSLTSGQAET